MQSVSMKPIKCMAVFNHKGGVGKTTTTVNLAASLVHAHKKRVLVIDMDPQANATRALIGREFGPERVTMKNVLLPDTGHPISLDEVIMPTTMPGLVLAPTALDLSEAEFKLFSTMRREFILRDALCSVRDSFDYILIDCPPSMGLLTLNALTAADGVIVCCECQFLSLRGLKFLLEVLMLVERKLNPDLRTLGVVATKYYILSKANQEALNCLRGLKEQIHVFDAVIPRDVRAEESPSHGKPLVLYAPDGRATEAYLKLADEVMRLCRN